MWNLETIPNDNGAYIEIADLRQKMVSWIDAVTLDS